jgi:hypothetical protein
MTNRDKVLDFMKSIAPNGATNEEIVSRTGVRPHPQVFQITRKLKNEGLLKAVQAGNAWRFWYAGKQGGAASPAREVELPRRKPVKDEQQAASSVTFRDPESIVVEERSGKPTLSTDALLAGGFSLAARWKMAPDGRPQLDATIPKDIGVYAFASNGRALYVGVATMGLRKRIYFYGRPGPTQRTSQRLHDLIKQAVASGREIEVYVALPPDLVWNGLPIHGSAGLELGLIRKYSLTWNKRSAA